MRAVALVFSARDRGNCYDFARFVLDRMKEEGAETELVNICDYSIQPCQGCNYECLPQIGPDTGQKTSPECPVRDDIASIWQKVWRADVFVMLVPTYGGVPPALYVSFTQRYQSLWEKAPPKAQLQRKVIAAVVIATPDGAMGGELTPAIVAGELRCHISMGYRQGGFEVVNDAGFKTRNVRGHLIQEEEIQNRLSFLTKRILETSLKVQ